MHVPDTAIEGVIQFDKAFNAQLDKDGIIVDERDNSGGQIPDFYTEKLKRQLLAVVAARDTKDIPWPPVAIYGPKVMIVTSSPVRVATLSRGSSGVKKLDPSSESAPGAAWLESATRNHYATAEASPPGLRFLEHRQRGEWVVEDHGVDPDYVVPTPDLVVSGHDPSWRRPSSWPMKR